MLFTRKIGKLLLGATIPFQLYAACILGALLGLLPGVMEAPALLALLIVLVLVLNCNLYLMGIVVLLTKAVTLLMLPVYFQIGRFLLDGPAQPLLKSMINAPILALGGFEYYVIAGGLIPTLVMGIVLGFVISTTVRRMQRTYVSMDKGSDKFRTWTNKGWVKFLTWLLLGAKPDPAVYEKLLGQRIGNPIRLVGVIAAVVLIISVVIISMALSGPLLTNFVRSSMEDANGATVDLESSALVLKESRFTLQGLAVADSNDLKSDIFKADTVQCDISGMDLLRRRLHLSDVTVSGAVSGTAREVPGQLTRPKDKVEEKAPEGEGKTIDDYMKDAEKWKDRLKQAQHWLEKMSGPERPEEGEGAEGKETLEERLNRQIREQGYFAVKAAHLIDGAPTILISKLTIDGMPVKDLDNREIAVNGANLSTQPYLVAGAPSLFAANDDKSYLLDVTMGAAAKVPSQNALKLNVAGIPLDSLTEQMSSSDYKVKGGTVDVSGDGVWSSADGLDLPLNVVLRNVKVAGVTSEPINVDKVELTLTAYGPMGNPRVKVSGGMSDALKDTGKRELGKLAEEQLDKAGIDAGTKEQAKGLLNKFLGGGKKEADSEAK